MTTTTVFALAMAATLALGFAAGYRAGKALSLRLRNKALNQFRDAVAHFVTFSAGLDRGDHPSQGARASGQVNHPGLPAAARARQPSELHELTCAEDHRLPAGEAVSQPGTREGDRLVDGAEHARGVGHVGPSRSIATSPQGRAHLFVAKLLAKYDGTKGGRQ